MLQSRLFTKTFREAPKDEEAVNARLLARGGFVYKNSAGIYSFLPLGLRVLRNIETIIREEMDVIGGQEMFMAALHDKHYLQATKRWDVDVVFKVLEESGKEPNFNISWTHEEIITEIATRYVRSYKDLPFAAYQFQTKFRNEPRPKSGLLRGREFLMKDLYSFHATEEDFKHYYEEVAGAYKKIFKRCGMQSYYTLAAGGEFTASYTHEFQVVADVGEDTILACQKCDYAENKEISKLKEEDACPKCGGVIRMRKSIEVGNIFPLGTKYSDAFNLSFADADGTKKPVIMGSYGIGVGRLMATAVELFNDPSGIIWPESIAPFKVHLLELGAGRGAVVYRDVQARGVDVLYDERDVSAGEKFADADLIGIPWRAVVSEKTGDNVEVKRRNEKEARIMSMQEFAALLTPNT